MDGFERVAASGEVTGPPYPLVEVAGRQIVLVRTDDGVIRAFPNTCPHLGQPLRSGELHGPVLECPTHFYAYDLTDGHNTFPGDDRDLELQVFEVREQDGQVHVRVPPDTPEQPTTAEPPDSASGRRFGLRGG
ncbi:MAG: Rieske 2Fe-2S domain-containing protein [Nitriliruptorales bacterium]|nr:Rieske 2Fe-2S domain-containing protein [Nitriliruptorales bacterium]